MSEHKQYQHVQYGLTSRPYHPDPAKCCEACAFGRGEHAAWCERKPDITLYGNPGIVVTPGDTPREELERIREALAAYSQMDKERKSRRIQ